MSEPPVALATAVDRLQRVAVHARRGALVAVIVVVGALALVSRQAPSYRSSATVVVGLRTFENGAPAQAPNMANERAIALSAGVAQLVARELRISPPAAADGLSVSVPLESSVLEISTTSSDAADAQRRAEAFADAYVAYRATLTDTEAASQAATGAARVSQSATVISRSRLPTARTTPNWPVGIAAAVMMGLTLGALTTFALSALDDRVRSLADLEATLGVPALGAVSATPSSDAELECYRRLRAEVLRAARETGARTVLVTSALASEGAPTVATLLAITLARAGKRTLLIGPDAPSAAMVPDDLVGLAIATFDVPPRSDGDRLAIAAAEGVASHLRTDRDLVVMYAESVNDASLAFALAGLADLTLLVAVPGRSRLARLGEAVAELGRTPTRVLGLVALLEERPGLRGRLRGSRRDRRSTFPVGHAAGAATG